MANMDGTASMEKRPVALRAGHDNMANAGTTRFATAPLRGSAYGIAQRFIFRIRSAALPGNHHRHGQIAADIE